MRSHLSLTLCILSMLAGLAGCDRSDGGGGTAPPPGANNPPSPPPPPPPAVVAPSIATQPADMSVVAPATASFAVTASGTPTPNYQWQVSTDGVTYADVAGATTGTYDTGPTNASQSGRSYRVVVTNSAGAVTSASATLTVSSVPAIATQPASHSVSAPAAATFSASATGAPSPTYQWQLSTDGVTYADIAGATGATYDTGPTSAAQSGRRFRVIATNSAGSVTSDAAVLTVTAVAAWSTPAKIGGDNASQAAVAASPDGYAIIAWIQYDAPDQQYNAYARAFDARANAWGNDRLIETLTTHPEVTGYLSKGAYEPRVAVGENGKGAVLFGYSLPPTSYGIRLVRHHPSPSPEALGMDTWSDVETINATGENVSSHALTYVSTVADEYFLSGFSQYDPDTSVSGAPKYRAFAQPFHYACRNAPACTHSPDLHSNETVERSPGHSGNVALSRVGNDGVAVWTQQWPASIGIWTSRFDGDTTTWSTPEQLNAGSTAIAYPPSVAGNSSGSAIAAWLELIAGQMQVFASRLQSSGWSAPVRMDDTVAPATPINIGSDLPSVSVAIDADGNAVIAWGQRQIDNGMGRVRARRCAASESLNACGGIAALSNGATPSTWAHADASRLVSLPNGDFWAIWKQQTPTFDSVVYVSRYRANSNQWDAPELLGGVSLGNSHPEIAVDGMGRATVVWADANDNHIYFSRNE